MLDYICTRCDYTGPKQKYKPGSLRMEVFWWLMFPIGPIYTVWRIMAQRQGCPKCGERVMVPVRDEDMLDEAEEMAVKKKPVNEVAAAPAVVKPPRKDADMW